MKSEKKKFLIANVATIGRFLTQSDPEKLLPFIYFFLLLPASLFLFHAFFSSNLLLCFCMFKEKFGSECGAGLLLSDCIIVDY